MKQAPKCIERHRTDERTAAISVMCTKVTLSVHKISVMEDSYTGLLPSYLCIYLFIAFLMTSPPAAAIHSPMARGQ
jgi:hypothetical protein